MAKKSDEPVIGPAVEPTVAPVVEPTVETMVEPTPANAAKPISFGDVGYRDRPIDPKDLEGDANTVLVQAIASFAGIEGDKGPSSEPFEVSRQRFADLKANGLVKLVK